jgi:hypothetical protein
MSIGTFEFPTKKIGSVFPHLPGVGGEDAGLLCDNGFLKNKLYI